MNNRHRRVARLRWQALTAQERRVCKHFLEIRRGLARTGATALAQLLTDKKK